MYSTIRSALVIAIGSLWTVTAVAQSPPVFTKTLGDWVVQVYERAGPNDATAEFVATRGGEIRRNWLDRRTRKVEDVLLWNDTFVVFDVGGAASHVNVIRPTASEPDFFSSYFPVISPDNRLIVYLRFFPPASDEPFVYLAYDVALSAAQNRIVGGSQPVSELADVGWPFYPDSNRLLRIYGQAGPSPAELGLGSKFTWIDARRMAFLAYFGGKSRVLLVDFTPGITAPIVQAQELDETAIVDSTEVEPGTPAASIIAAESITSQILASGAVELSITFEKGPRPFLKTPSLTVTF